MTERTLIAAATNVLVRGYQLVPLERVSKQGEPANGLFAVARALTRVLAFKQPARAVAVINPEVKSTWPEPLKRQHPQLSALCSALGFSVVESRDELHLCASYAQAALELGDDVLIAAVDKRCGQLVSDEVSWFDTNKDVRYTPDIIKKRFGVAPAQVGQWLALVGDEDELAGVKGIGAKGATELLLEHGTVEAALAKPALSGRVAKALVQEEHLSHKLEEAHLERNRSLPTPLQALAYRPAPVEALNALYESLGFTELLKAQASTGAVETVEDPQVLESMLAKTKTEPTAFSALLDDDEPLRRTVFGIALSNPTVGLVWVRRASPAWSVLARWLEDPTAPKTGHDVVETMVALRREGVTLAQVVSDSACLSHLTQPSNWAPHDLSLVARHALGRALFSDDDVRGVGKSRKGWRHLSGDTAAQTAGDRASAISALVSLLSDGVDHALLREYLELSGVLVEMELTGLRVDASELERAEASFATIESELEKEISALAGHAFNINSSKQLGEVLFEQLKLPVVSHTRTGWSTANEALERIHDAHPIVPLVIRWRGLRRLRDSWLISLRKCIDADGRVHSRFHLARSFAGDLINSNPDLGRVPGRTPEMARVRRAFVASDGHVLMSVDFHQLGLYVLAHLSKDPALVEPLRRNADIHRLTAAAILQKPEASLTLAERQIGKVVNFATFAGQGASALGMQLGISPQQAKDYVARFDAHYAKVRAFQDEQLRGVRERGYLVTLAGRRWPIGGLSSLDPQLQSYAERLARRGTHEGSVADVSRRALLRAAQALKREGLKTVPLLQILDEVLFEVPEAELPDAARICASAMRSAFELEVPLVVGVEVGKNWADLEPLQMEPVVPV